MNRFLSIFLLLLTISCISPLELDIDREENILVVEGYISTLPGPYGIQLTTSAKYGSVLDGFVKPMTGAEVWIKDDLGNTIFLSDENDFGVYYTPDGFRGEVGRTYVLNIETILGINYTSLPETIIPVPPVDSIYFEYKEQPTSDPLDFKSGIDVYGVLQDPSENPNFYLWRNSGIYFVQTFPEDHVALGPFGPVPAPKNCCKDCWVYERNADNSITIANDNNTNGQTKTQRMAFIEDNGVRFADKYQISIQQLSISKEAYQFLNVLKNQKSIDGDIFDPPPATIRGNIINLDDPEANVIGYFYTSDGKEISGFFDRSIFENFQNPKKINDDCRVISGATTLKPENWD